MENKKIEFETFRQISGYYQNQLILKDPSAFNGEVRIKKFKVTIEPIEEPNEVYCQRIQQLWDYCDNHHHWTPIQNVASQLGYTLQGERGNKVVKK